MKKMILLFAAALVMLGGLTGCKTHDGSREFVPGKGWRPVR